MWGVGKVTGGVLDKIGVTTIGGLRLLDPDILTQHFGQQGEHFAKLARGIDDRRVVPDREAKSISHETTFAVDISDGEALRAWLYELTEHVGRRMRQQQRRGRTVNLKLRFANFRTITRAKTLPRSTNVTQEIWQAAAELLKEALPGSHHGIRLLGVGMSSFAGSEFVQKTLFEEDGHHKQQQLDEVADAVRKKFGSTALNRGSGMLHNARHRPEPRPNE
jgi:DNA polymerase-4